MALSNLERLDAPAPLRLSLIWASLVALFLYNDYFSLYVPGTIDGMQAGIMGPLGPATPWVMAAVAALMAIPSVMIALSVLLPPLVSRWSNLRAGLLFLVINALTLIDAPLFYRVIVMVELGLTIWLLTIAWLWRVRPDST